jgi:hypothetical protein
VTRQAYEQLRTGLAAAPTPTEPLNTILQAIVQHCSDATMTFDDLRVLNRLIEKVEQAAAPTPAEPLAVDVLARALHEESNTIGCMGNYETCLSRNEHERIARAALAAAAPTPDRCDRIVNNGMGEPTECGRTLPCEVHDAPTPAEPLDVLHLARAMADDDGAGGTGYDWNDLSPGAQTIYEKRAASILARLAAARPETPASAEQPGLREALERTLANFKALLARKPVRDATETIAEAEAALAASPSPEPEGGIMVARGVERYR